MALVDGVRLVRNDGSEEFVFKAEVVEDTHSNGLVTDSIVSALREVIGGKLVFDKETVKVEGIIKDAEASHYPNSGTYSNGDLGFERELNRAAKEWGYDTTDGFDLLYWDDRSPIQGVITEATARENAADPEMGPGSYEFTLEFTYLDAYIS